jgi:hypothetical protein
VAVELRGGYEAEKYAASGAAPVEDPTNQVTRL